MTMSNLLDLTDRVAVVIGGTSGIGLAIAVGLARHGAHVVPTGRRAQLVAGVCDEIHAAGVRTLQHPADVTDPQSLDMLRDAVLLEFGRVDILVNAAGYTFKQPTAEVSAACNGPA